MSSKALVSSAVVGCNQQQLTVVHIGYLKHASYISQQIELFFSLFFYTICVFVTFIILYIFGFLNLWSILNAKEYLSCIAFLQMTLLHQMWYGYLQLLMSMVKSCLIGNHATFSIFITETCAVYKAITSYILL